MTINEMLLEMGITPNCKGFHHLKKAIEIVKDNFEKEQYFFKYTAVYHDVAKVADSTAARVERAMRHVIEVAFSHPTPKLREVFGKFIDCDKSRASVSCFISTVANYMLEQEADNLTDREKRLKGLLK